MISDLPGLWLERCGQLLIVSKWTVVMSIQITSFITCRSECKGEGSDGIH